MPSHLIFLSIHHCEKSGEGPGCLIIYRNSSESGLHHPYLYQPVFRIRMSPWRTSTTLSIIWGVYTLVSDTRWEISAITPGPTQCSRGTWPMARPLGQKGFSPSMWEARGVLAVER